MAKGDPPTPPWVWTGGDYLDRKIVISVYFNNATRQLTNTGPGGACVVIHRDNGCLWHTIVFDVPTDAAKARRLAAPVDGAADRGYTVAQVRSASTGGAFPSGWQTFEDTQTVQITAER
jgi:hypothetical protein